MKKIYKCLFVLFFVFVIFFNINVVECKKNAPTDATTDITLNGIINGGSNWFNNAKSGGIDKNTDLGGIFSDILGTKGSGGLLDGIFQVGNLIFICVTILLGIKYAFTSVEGKVDVKESLIPLSIGAIFFYLPQSVYKFSKAIFKGFSTADNMSTITDRIFTTVSTLANVCAIAAIVIMGLKYMFTAADEKAELKQRMVPLVIGLALIYASAQILGFVVSVGSSVLT